MHRKPNVYGAITCEVRPYDVLGFRFDFVITIAGVVAYRLNSISSDIVFLHIDLCWEVTIRQLPFPEETC